MIGEGESLCSLVFCSISRSFSVDIIELSLKASTLRFKAVKSGIAVSVNEIVFWQVLESKSSEIPNPSPQISFSRVGRRVGAVPLYSTGLGSKFSVKSTLLLFCLL